MSLFADILKNRGLTGPVKDDFLNPDYAKRHDPFLLPDMRPAVDRLVQARQNQHKITIYGDYDIDGLTATTVLLDAFDSFGFEHVKAFIPNRFKEGYGLTIDAVEQIAADGAQLIITVDCGSLSTAEIERANQLGVDVIVTDHHNVQPVQPPAVAVINPKRLLMDYPQAYEDFILKPDYRIEKAEEDSSDTESQTGSSSFSETASRPISLEPASGSIGAADVSEKEISQSTLAQPSDPNSYPGLYPFLDLPGVGVAFKLVQALQTELDGLDPGHEKWLLDLVALGTVCDVVTLRGENRMHVYWGLQVLAQTRRLGLKALMAVAAVEPKAVKARDLGFGLGPRMNAAGRLETAQYALDMLRATDGMEALQKARLLDDMNQDRRRQQDKILAEALIQAEKYQADPVLVVSSAGWSHGIIGIVAAKLLEKFSKPTFVLEESGDESKGSARSYGDFSAADAIRASDDIITKGGGHKMAAGVTLPTKNIQAFRDSVNDYYKKLKLDPAQQRNLLLPKADASGALTDVSEQLVDQINSLEPFGSGNGRPVIKSHDLLVDHVRRMGQEGQHVKLTLSQAGKSMQFIAFSAPEHFFVEPGDQVDIWYQPDINEWRGNRSVEGRLLHLERQ